MTRNKRKVQRRPVRQTAWVLLPDNKKYGCLLSNISDAGACIEVEDTATVPDDFLLLLSANGTARRGCHVIWRHPAKLGVRFERHDGPAPLVPEMDADAESAPADAAAAEEGR